jgi:hypothetical protein
MVADVRRRGRRRAPRPRRRRHPQRRAAARRPGPAPRGALCRRAPSQTATPTPRPLARPRPNRSPTSRPRPRWTCRMETTPGASTQRSTTWVRGHGRLPGLPAELPLCPRGASCASAAPPRLLRHPRALGVLAPDRCLIPARPSPSASPQKLSSTRSVSAARQRHSGSAQRQREGRIMGPGRRRPRPRPWDAVRVRRFRSVRRRLTTPPPCPLPLAAAPAQPRSTARGPSWGARGPCTSAATAQGGADQPRGAGLRCRRAALRAGIGPRAPAAPADFGSTAAPTSGNARSHHNPYPRLPSPRLPITGMMVRGLAPPRAGRQSGQPLAKEARLRPRPCTCPHPHLAVRPTQKFDQEDLARNPNQDYWRGVILHEMVGAGGGGGGLRRAAKRGASASGRGSPAAGCSCQQRAARSGVRALTARRALAGAPCLLQPRVALHVAPPPLSPGPRARRRHALGPARLHLQRLPEQRRRNRPPVPLPVRRRQPGVLSPLLRHRGPHRDGDGRRVGVSGGRGGAGSLGQALRPPVSACAPHLCQPLTPRCRPSAHAAPQPVQPSCGHCERCRGPGRGPSWEAAAAGARAAAATGAPVSRVRRSHTHPPPTACPNPPQGARRPCGRSS